MLIENHQEKRGCLCCGKAIKGRSDKKFCDDYCRNHFNNQLRSNPNACMRKINSILRKNRKLLAELIPEGSDKARVKRQKLFLKGFDFKYFTHQYANKKSHVYNYCYDHGYLSMGEDELLLVRES